MEKIFHSDYFTPSYTDVMMDVFQRMGWKTEGNKIMIPDKDIHIWNVFEECEMV